MPKIVNLWVFFFLILSIFRIIAAHIRSYTWIFVFYTPLPLFCTNFKRRLTKKKPGFTSISSRCTYSSFGLDTQKIHFLFDVSRFFSHFPAHITAYIWIFVFYTLWPLFCTSFEQLSAQTTGFTRISSWSIYSGLAWSIEFPQ